MIFCVDEARSDKQIPVRIAKNVEIGYRATKTRGHTEFVYLPDDVDLRLLEPQLDYMEISTTYISPDDDQINVASKLCTADVNNSVIIASKPTEMVLAHTCSDPAANRHAITFHARFPAGPDDDTTLLQMILQLRPNMVYIYTSINDVSGALKYTISNLRAAVMRNAEATAHAPP